MLYAFLEFMIITIVIIIIKIIMEPCIAPTQVAPEPRAPYMGNDLTKVQTTGYNSNIYESDSVMSQAYNDINESIT